MQKNDDFSKIVLQEKLFTEALPARVKQTVWNKEYEFECPDVPILRHLLAISKARGSDGKGIIDAFWLS